MSSWHVSFWHFWHFWHLPDYIPKPVRQSKLHDVLTRVLSIKVTPEMKRHSSIAEPTEKRWIFRENLRKNLRIYTDIPFRSLLSVLLVEDNVVNQKVKFPRIFRKNSQKSRRRLTVEQVALRQLEAIGITRVVLAANGAEAVALVEKSQNYSVILMWVFNHKFSWIFVDFLQGLPNAYNEWCRE